jgi:Ni,Fe-hydrogenase I cytochrome b subunit
MNSKTWWAPLSGIVFAAVLVTGFYVGGEPPSASEHSAEKLASMYVANADQLRMSAYILAVALVFFVYFASILKSALDSAAGEMGCLSRVAFAGAIIFTVGAATDITLIVAICEAAKHIDPVAVQAMGAYWDNDFVPFAVGVELLMSATAISSLRHGGIPKWLGALAAVIAVVGLTPWGFFAMPATGIWIILVSVVLALRAKKADV